MCIRDRYWVYHTAFSLHPIIHRQQRRPLCLALRVVREDQWEGAQDVGELAARRDTEMGSQFVGFYSGLLQNAEQRSDRQVFFVHRNHGAPTGLRVKVDMMAALDAIQNKGMLL